MSSEEKEIDNSQNPYGYVFGYGSIITSRSRYVAEDPQKYVRRISEFGYRRKWNFRSPTGFTALGLSKVKRKENRSTVNGVLFACSMEQMKSTDQSRERIRKSTDSGDLVEILDETKHTNKLIAEVPIYVYVPPLDMCSRASEKYPICQTYIDCVMSGLLDTGESSVNEFIRTTFDWTSFYLYDTPMSRRPWLHRGD